MFWRGRNPGPLYRAIKASLLHLEYSVNLLPGFQLHDFYIPGSFGFIFFSLNPLPTFWHSCVINALSRVGLRNEQDNAIAESTWCTACQVWVTVGNSGLCCCICVTSFECWLTPMCVDSLHVPMLRACREYKQEVWLLFAWIWLGYAVTHVKF